MAGRSQRGGAEKMKKKVGAAIISLLLLFSMTVSFACFADSTAESASETEKKKSGDFTPFDYHIKYTANGKSVIYEFPDIMLYLPIEWEDALTVKETGESTAFYQTASYEKFLEEKTEGGGFLFSLCASKDESFRELPAYKELGYSDNAGLWFYLSLPSDYPASLEEEIRAEYDAMSGQIDEIAESSKISESMHFYTDGIEWTDAGKS